MAVTYTGKYGVRVFRVTLTSDASGDATQTVVMDGAIVRVVTNPSATAPTANWDVTLVGPDGEDLAAGELVDRHTSNTEQVFLTDTPFHYGDVIVTGANMGNAKIADVVLYVAYGGGGG